MVAVRPSTGAAAAGVAANLRTAAAEGAAVAVARSTWARSRSTALTMVCARNSTPVSPHLWAGSGPGYSVCAKDATRPADFPAMSNGAPTSRPYPK